MHRKRTKRNPAKSRRRPRVVAAALCPHERIIAHPISQVQSEFVASKYVYDNDSYWRTNRTQRQTNYGSHALAYGASLSRHSLIPLPSAYSQRRVQAIKIQQTRPP